jgi:hypothetical protein
MQLDDETLQQLGFPIPWEAMAELNLARRKAASSAWHKSPWGKAWLARWRRTPEQRLKQKIRRARYSYRQGKPQTASLAPVSPTLCMLSFGCTGERAPGKMGCPWHEAVSTAWAGPPTGP